jgi:hypothetical protein
MNITIHARLIKDDAFIEKCSITFLNNGYNVKGKRFEDFLMIESYRIAKEYDDRDPLGGINKFNSNSSGLKRRVSGIKISRK